jgi:hypothetical protein
MYSSVGQLLFYSNSSVALTVSTSQNATFAGAIADASTQRRTSTGNFTIANNIGHQIVDAGTQTTLTVTMPSSPINGQVITIAFVGAITTLSVVANSGQTLDGTPTSAALNAFASWIYLTATATWYRRG